MCTFSPHICDPLCLSECCLLPLSPFQTHTHTDTNMHTHADMQTHTSFCVCFLQSVSHTHTNAQIHMHTSLLNLKTWSSLPRSTAPWFQLEPVTYKSQGQCSSSRAIFQMLWQKPGSQVFLFLPGIKHDDHLLMKLDLEVKFIICHVLSFNFEFM